MILPIVLLICAVACVAFGLVLYVRWENEQTLWRTLRWMSKMDDDTLRAIARLGEE